MPQRTATIESLPMAFEVVKELALAGIATVEAADRFIADTYLPDHNRRFTTPPELEDSAFVPLEHPGQIDDILCLHTERTVARDNTVRYESASSRFPPPQPDTTTSRPGSGSTSIQTEPSPSSTGPDASPATPPTASPSKPQPGRPRETLRRDRPAPCGQVDSRAAPDHFPTGPTGRLLARQPRRLRHARSPQRHLSYRAIC